MVWVACLSSSLFVCVCACVCVFMFRCSLCGFQSNNKRAPVPLLCDLCKRVRYWFHKIHWWEKRQDLNENCANGAKFVTLFGCVSQKHRSLTRGAIMTITIFLCLCECSHICQEQATNRLKFRKTRIEKDRRMNIQNPFTSFGFYFSPLIWGALSLNTVKA